MRSEFIICLISSDDDRFYINVLVTLKCECSLKTCAFISIQWRRVRNDHSDSQVEPRGCVAFSSLFAWLFNPSFIDE